jgi:hypothetical protein
VTTRRDGRIILFLMINAALNAASTTAYLSSIAPKGVTAVVGLVSAMWSAATGIYVTVTQETQKPGRADS